MRNLSKIYLFWKPYASASSSLLRFEFWKSLLKTTRSASWVMRNLTKIYLFWKLYTSASSSLLTIFGYSYINVYPLELHNSIRWILYISIENNKKCRLSCEELDKDLSILEVLYICQFITVNWFWLPIYKCLSIWASQ